jgi:ketosteroid isomerase-like protein
MSSDAHDFEQFMKLRENAARAYVGGDAAPVDRILTRVSPSTFFGPSGGYEQGADHVCATHQHGSEQFQPGGDSHFEILQMGASDGIAYWVGLQHATARMRGKTEAIPFKLRVTEVFRREDDNWKLVHRHADALSDSEQAKK